MRSPSNIDFQRQQVRWGMYFVGPHCIVQNALVYKVFTSREVTTGHHEVVHVRPFAFCNSRKHRW
jgi:hypothetical protein